MFARDWMTSPNSSSLPRASNTNKNHPIQGSEQLFYTSCAYFFDFYRCTDVADLREHACLSSGSIHPTNQQTDNIHGDSYYVFLHEEVHVYTWGRLGSCFHGALHLNGNFWVTLQTAERTMITHLEPFHWGTEKGLSTAQRVWKRFTEEMTSELNLNCL